MSPTDGLTRAEFESRMEQIQRAMRQEMSDLRAENTAAQQHQEMQWSQGLRQLREDLHAGRDSLRDDIQEMLTNFVTKDVFVARLTPIQAIAYGIVALVVTLMTGVLGMALAFRKG